MASNNKQQISDANSAAIEEELKRMTGETKAELPKQQKVESAEEAAEFFEDEGKLEESKNFVEKVNSFVKNNKKFFAGFGAGVVALAVVARAMANKVEAVVNEQIETSESDEG